MGIRLSKEEKEKCKKIILAMLLDGEDKSKISRHIGISRSTTRQYIKELIEDRGSN